MWVVASALVATSAGCTSLSNLSGGAPTQADAGADADASSDAEACASADTQRDARNCGRCGHDCVGGACLSGRCSPIVLATGQPGVEDLARGPDGTLYWANLGDGSVVSMAVGGQPRSIATAQLGPQAIAVDARRVVWTCRSGGTIAAAVGGGPISTVAMGQTDPFDIALDGTTIAWVNRTAGAVLSLRDGELPRTIASAQSTPSAIAIGDGAVYWTVEGTGSADGTIARASLDGAGGVVVLASGLLAPRGIAYSAGTVFATSSGSIGAAPSVVAVPASGGLPLTLATGQLAARGIAADSRFVYWVNDRAGGDVMAVPRTGGAPVALASGQSNPRALALDETSVYFANAGDGSIVRVAKP